MSRPLSSRTVLRTVVIVCAVTGALVWTVATAGLYAAMRQSPEKFGAIMSHVPGMAMMVLPFKPLWMSARAGHLHVGDQAPDFSLATLHGEGTVTLSQEYKAKPVVLVFGSYT